MTNRIPGAFPVMFWTVPGAFLDSTGKFAHKQLYFDNSWTRSIFTAAPIFYGVRDCKKCELAESAGENAPGRSIWVKSSPKDHRLLSVRRNNEFYHWEISHKDTLVLRNTFLHRKKCKMKISGFHFFLQFGANTKIKLPQAMSARQNLPRVEIRQQSHRFFCLPLPSHPTCMVRLSWHRVNCKPGLISGGGGSTSLFGEGASMKAEPVGY